MIKSRELTDPSSCMSRARDDEMTFVLLGRDVAAPKAIRAWIAERVRLGKNAPHDPQLLEAAQCAQAMEASQARFAFRSSSTAELDRLRGLLTELGVALLSPDLGLHPVDGSYAAAVDAVRCLESKVRLEARRLAKEKTP